MDSPICVALDERDRDDIERLAAATADHVGMYKVGLTTFSTFGPELLASLGQRHPVFLDLKLHDIPVQVEGAIRSVVELGASITTVHASGGRAMLEAAVSGAEGRVKVVAVTVLTSLDDDDLVSIGIKGGARVAVLRLAHLALGSGLDGLVCSPLEVEALRVEFGPRERGGPLLIVPGIRPVVRGAGSEGPKGEEPVAADDQRRTLTPTEAIEAGADVIVVGRPITRAPDPAAAAEGIARSIQGAFA